MSRSVCWVDANVFLRFLTGEPEDMSERAERFLERAQRREVALKVHAIVVAETVWVLQSFYGYSRAEISGVLIAVVSAVDPLAQLSASRVNRVGNGVQGGLV